MGFCAFCVDVGLETLNSWKFGAVKEVVRNYGGFWGPYATFLAFCLVYAGVSGAIVSFVAPLAAGSGIPEMKTYLNGVHIKGEGCRSSRTASACILTTSISSLQSG